MKIRPGEAGVRLAAAAALAAFAGGVASAEEAEPAGAPAGESSLRCAVEGLIGTEVHGRLTTKWQSRVLRGPDDENDHDVSSLLDLRVGDEAKDVWSANVFVRGAYDVGREDRDRGSALWSLADTGDHELTGLLYTAYGTWRPAKGRSKAKIDSVRVGRQYVDVAETFHIDGVSAATEPLVESVKLRLRAYAGVPVHFYEASPAGDRVVGARADAVPWQRGRVSLDFAHVRDRLAGADREKDNLGAVQVGHAFTDNVDASARFTWLDGPRDAKLRAAVNLPEHDLVVQASYFRLLDEEERLVTEFDPFFAALRTLEPYHTGDLRVVKGLGDSVSVEAGVSARRLSSGGDEGPYNRETTRLWLAPTFDDLLWDGLSVSVGVVDWSGDDEGIRTWTADLSQKVAPGVRVSLGSDLSRYDWDRLRLGERENVRSVWGRLRAELTESLGLDVRYTWERDEEETYHVATIALAFDF